MQTILAAEQNVTKTNLGPVWTSSYVGRPLFTTATSSETEYKPSAFPTGSHKNQSRQCGTAILTCHPAPSSTELVSPGPVFTAAPATERDPGPDTQSI